MQIIGQIKAARHKIAGLAVGNIVLNAGNDFVITRFGGLVIPIVKIDIHIGSRITPVFIFVLEIVIPNYQFVCLPQQLEWPLERGVDAFLVLFGSHDTCADFG
ncbi:hypothetical protein D3C79_777150 [compost metagenome]